MAHLRGLLLKRHAMDEVVDALLEREVWILKGKGGGLLSEGGGSDEHGGKQREWERSQGHPPDAHHSKLSSPAVARVC
jgi:hypothetical protein